MIDFFFSLMFSSDRQLIRLGFHCFPFKPSFACMGVRECKARVKDKRIFTTGVLPNKVKG